MDAGSGLLNSANVAEGCVGHLYFVTAGIRVAYIQASIANVQMLRAITGARRAGDMVVGRLGDMVYVLEFLWGLEVESGCAD